MKISVIIPVYNSEKYIERCLNSIINQTYKNLEIILLNDGSTDKSYSIIEEYKKLDSRIKLINQNNQGVAKTRNKGILNSTGELIMFVDNDDYLDCDYIKKLYDEIEDNDVIVSGYKRVTDKKIIYKKKIKKNNWGKFENVAPWGKLIKRNYLVKNNIQFYDYSIGEDIIFNFKLYTATKKIKIISNYGYNWYYNNNSVSNTRQKKFNKNILILLDEMAKNDKDEMTKYYIGRYYIWYLLFSGRYTKNKDFLSEYKKISEWMINNNYKNVISIHKILKNESSLKNKIIITIFYIIEKLKLISLFAKLYCKG